MTSRLQQACALSALFLTLTACSTNSGTSSPSSSASPPQASASGQPTASASSSPSAEPSPSASPSPDSSAGKTYRMNKVYSIVPIDKEKTESKVVLLTFDDGPKDPKTLDPILDILDKHHAKAIFFVNGYRVKSHPELLKQIDERGQTVGNHSYDHIQLGKEKADKIKQQIEDTQKIVKEVIGKTPVFFRPPNASGNPDVHAIAKENGLLYMTWSNGSLDWTLVGKKYENQNKPQLVIKNVIDQLHPGSNILMHELAWTGDALDELLTTLEKKGYGFVDPSAIEIEL